MDVPEEGKNVEDVSWIVDLNIFLALVGL